MMPRLVVDNEAGGLPEPPYPADVLARGWGFTLEVERLTNSDTWSLTPPDLRPWLLMLWMQSWVQTPCGSLPGDDALIAARIGMDPDLFAAKRDRLMRGWYRCSDGRLYHRVVTELVERMRDNRQRDKLRKQKQRELSAGVPRDTPVTPPGVTPQEAGSRKQEAGTGIATLTGSLSSSTPTTGYHPPDCPHRKVLELWANDLPELHQHDPDEWRGARADNLRARWREAAIKDAAKGRPWANEQDGLTYFHRLFVYARRSRFLMGEAGTAGDRRPFKLRLEWLVKLANWSKVIEGQYHEER